MLKVCTEQLAGVFWHIFDLCLRLKKVPKIWKTSCIVTVPKKGCPGTLNDFRSAALMVYVKKDP